MTHVASHFGTKKIQSNNVLSVLHCIAKLFNIVDVLGLAKGTKALFKIRWGFTNRYVHNCFINLLFPPGVMGLHLWEALTCFTHIRNIPQICKPHTKAQPSQICKMITESFLWQPVGLLSWFSLQDQPQTFIWHSGDMAETLKLRYLYSEKWLAKITSMII